MRQRSLRVLRPFCLALLPLSGGCGGSTSGPGPGIAHPVDLPLAPAVQCVGITSTESADPAVQARADAAFDESLAAGARLYSLGLTWDFLEPAPNVYATELLDLVLDGLATAGLAPMFTIRAADTVQLAIPAEFVDPGDSTSFAAGYGFESPEVRARFRALLDVVVPRLVAKGGFYLSVGNEVDT